ncbi:hypothetical protein V8C86DRAFT_2766147 [Haematococcus lacustris]
MKGAASRAGVRAGFTRRQCAPCCALVKPGMSGPVVAALNHARQEAARHGCIFAGSDHIVLGVLQTPCHAVSDILARHSIDYSSAASLADAKVVIPVVASSSVLDVDIAPQARDVIMYAQELAQEQGSVVVGIPHLGCVLLSSDTLLTQLALRQGLEARQLEDELLSSWQEHPEAAAGLPSAEEQVQRLKADYARMVAQGGAASPMAAGAVAATPGPAMPPPLTQQEHDDIYE